MILEYRRKYEPYLKDGKELHTMKEWMNKVASHIVRLAATLYMSHNPNKTIPGTEIIPDEFIQGGINLTYCFQSLWYNTFLESTPAALLGKDAQRVLIWLKDTQNPGDIVSLRQVYTNVRGLTSKMAREALALLSEYGCVEELQTEGRRDRKVYRFLQDIYSSVSSFSTCTEKSPPEHTNGATENVSSLSALVCTSSAVEVDQEIDDEGGGWAWLDEMLAIALPDGLPTRDEILASVAFIPDEAWDDDDDVDWALPTYIMHPMAAAA
jgi:hypothetical protein